VKKMHEKSPLDQQHVFFRWRLTLIAMASVFAFFMISFFLPIVPFALASTVQRAVTSLVASVISTAGVTFVVSLVGQFYIERLRFRNSLWRLGLAGFLIGCASFFFSAVVFCTLMAFSIVLTNPYIPHQLGEFFGQVTQAFYLLFAFGIWLVGPIGFLFASVASTLVTVLQLRRHDW